MVIERPQFMYMRVAVAIHGRDIERVLETYDLLSRRAYTPAAPALYNAGTTSQYLASCFTYQPPVDHTVSVMERSAIDVGAYWAADGDVGMSLGMVSAHTYAHAPSIQWQYTHTCTDRLPETIRLVPCRCLRFTTLTPDFSRSIAGAGYRRLPHICLYGMQTY